MTEMDGSFDEFVEGAAGSLFGYGRALTGSDDEAWDLVQEALARIGERWAKQRFDDPAAYARTAMVRLNVDRIRRARRDAALVRRSRVPKSYEMPQAEGLDSWLVEALGELSPKQRTALALRYVDDLDVTQIARRMGCRAGTARSHLSRGLARLKSAAAVAAPTGKKG